MLHDFLPLGRIVTVHGIHGEVQVQPETDEPELLWTCDRLFWDKNGQQPLQVIHGFSHKSGAVLQIAGIQTPEEGRAYRGRWIYAPREVFHLQPGQYFLADLIGCSVVDADTGKVYGILHDVLNHGAGQIYEIKTEDGKMLLAPAIPDVVIRLAPEEDRIEIRPLEGLFDA